MQPKHKILVTGATGFVGSHLIAHLSSGEEYGEVRVISAGRSASCDVALDISNPRSIDAAIQLTEPTAVVHLAAIANPGDALRDPDKAWSTNVDGTRHLARSILRHQLTCRLVYVSSSEAYGQSFLASSTPIKETSALRPVSSYGATKAASDMLIDQLSFSGLRAIRFRPFNHTGRGQSPDFVVPAFAQQAANIEAGLVAPKIVVGNLDARRDFLDVRDVVRAYAVAATTADPAALGAVFNLATGTPLRIGDILAFLLEKIGVDVAIETDPARMRPSEIPIASGDPSRVAESLGWSPSIGFEETMTQVLDFYRALTKQTTRLL